MAWQLSRPLDLMCGGILPTFSCNPSLLSIPYMLHTPLHVQCGLCTTYALMCRFSKDCPSFNTENIVSWELAKIQANPSYVELFCFPFIYLLFVLTWFKYHQNRDVFPDSCLFPFPHPDRVSLSIIHFDNTSIS